MNIKRRVRTIVKENNEVDIKRKIVSKQVFIDTNKVRVDRGYIKNDSVNVEQANLKAVLPAVIDVNIKNQQDTVGAVLEVRQAVDGLADSVNNNDLQLLKGFEKGITGFRKFIDKALVETSDAVVNGITGVLARILQLLHDGIKVVWDPKDVMKVQLTHNGDEYMAKGGTTVVGGGGGSGSSTSVLEQYSISDQDETTDTKYYGFLRTDGAWYILKIDESVSVPTYRYKRGSVDYISEWSNRSTLTYDYLNEVFS